MLAKLAKGVVLGVVIVSLSACSTYSKKHGKGSHDDSASTQGVGDSRSFEGSEEGNGNFIAKSSYLFGFDRFDVNSSDYDAINSHANYLTSHPNAKVRIEGHTDERGSREYNVALGERRAKAVSNILMSQGVLASQIHTVSYGQEKPVAFGHDESSWEQNRRASIVYEE